MSNKIYSHVPGPQPFKSILPFDRVDVDDDSVSNLDHYRHWGVFGLIDEPSMMVWTRQKGGQTEYYIPSHKDINDKDVEEISNIPESEVYYTDKRNPRVGTKSLFNNVNAVAFQPEYAIHMNAPLIDSQEVRKRMRDLGDCSIKALVEASEAGNMGRAVYDYADFMFCKYLGEVSNNYMITLRRFPYPAGDHINLSLHGESKDEMVNQGHMPDNGRLVTWMGTPGNEMENILKYKVLMPYKELTSSIEPVSGGGEGGGLMGTILNLTSPSYAHNVYKGRAGSSTIGYLKTAMGSGLMNRAFGAGRIGDALSGPRDEGAFGHQDRTKNYGPVDVISKTHIRQGGEDGGLTFEHDINLCFDYELRSYDGINTRAAFLDLLGNILAVTYVNGRFWKGMYMGSGVSQNHLFANLPIYNLKPGASLGDMYNAGVASLKMIGQEMNGGKPITSAKDIVSAIINVGKNLLSVLAGGLLNSLGRPQRQAVNSLLNDAPVGLWHLTIGNPKHPILSMGNMILTDVNIQHYGRLGLDDFPTGLRVNISLKHGMPRDAKNIEHMYMMGDFRIYQPMDKNIAYMYEASTDINDIKTASKRISAKGDNSGSGNFWNELNQDVGNVAKKASELGAKVKQASADAVAWVSDPDKRSQAKQSITNKGKSVARLMRAFGTNIKTNIAQGAEEAYLGSQKIDKNNKPTSKKSSN